ncbi:pentapeptide repeat-containing protein [Microcoleus sp. K1-B6]|uniref:pentapeptide repeat-containing protein n=1 Tax=unclassified Microcoleus TaxID=2642155 RepID=UPI002FD0AC9C
MNRYNRQAYGQKFSQASLNFDLQEVTGGQPRFFRFLALLCTLSLALFAGSFAGLLGGYLSRTLFYSSQPVEGAWLTASVVLVICVWSIETKQSSIASGLWKAGLTVVFTSIAAIMILQDPEFFWVTLLATSAFLGCYCLVFTASSFSLWLFLVLLKHSFHNNVKTLHKILIIICSTLISYMVGNEPPVKSAIASQYFAEIKLLAGFAIGVLTVQLSFDVIDVNGKPKKNFEFFRNWAIAFSTLRSTSFYSLDLSGINFTGAKLANTDLRARKLYRTRFKNVEGLERARVDNRYLDLDEPKVQMLLTRGDSEEKDFRGINLQGAYLQDATMREYDFTNANLSGADLNGADLRDSIFVQTDVTGVDFTEATLTGICIENWNINSQTCFTNVKCDYILRKLDSKGKPTDRHPTDRNFNPREFESIYQEVGNIVELVFKEGVNWRAFAFTLQKLQLEDEGMGLELRGIEKRGDLWIVKVAHNEMLPNTEVERNLYGRYEEMQTLLVTKEQQINQLLGIVADQAVALKGYSQKPFGQNFFISGSTITNLAGEAIEYCEAAGQVRSIIASPNLGEIVTTTQSFLTQLSGQKVAATAETQVDLILQVMLAEAEKDPIFKQFLRQQGQQILATIPEGAIATALRGAIAQL